MEMRCDAISLVLIVMIWFKSGDGLNPWLDFKQNK